MMLQIPGVLTPQEAAGFQQELEAADWIDGRGTAGHLSHGVKRNGQLHYANPVARRLGGAILERLERNGLFVSAALPHSILPPLFNRYGESEHYGAHVDGAIRPVDGTPHRIRTDLSATLFLTPPEDYDGGELIVHDRFEARTVKLRAGDMVLYPGTTLHEVTPVTRGARIASFFWIQSLVRSSEDRGLLFELDSTIQQLPRTDDSARSHILQLTNVYHNLLRRWADL